MKIESVESKKAEKWIPDAYAVFKKQPGILILFLIIDLAIAWSISKAAPLGSLISVIVSSLFAVGWLNSSKKASLGGILKIEDIFSGFNNECIPVIIYSIITVVFGAVSALPFFVVFIVGTTVGNKMLADNPALRSVMPQFSIALFWVFIAFLISLVLFTVYCCAIWFALPLISLGKKKIGEALISSFEASMKNMWPLTIYSLFMVALLFVGVVTLGLGYLVVIPVMNLSRYYSYRDIFESNSAPAPSTVPTERVL